MILFINIDTYQQFYWAYALQFGAKNACNIKRYDTILRLFYLTVFWVICGYNEGGALLHQQLCIGDV